MTPQPAPRPCLKPGCPRYAEHRGYCGGHKGYAANRYDRGRGTSKQRGYSGRWRRVRNRQLSRQPMCVGCGQVASEVDHVVPIRQGGARYAPDNLQSMCHRCHMRKHAKGG